MQHAVVYGVRVPHVEGRVGMAALVTTDSFDLRGLRQHLAHTLPPYARPMFLRLRERAEVTSTWKYAKADLAREGFDPHEIADPLYIDLPGAEIFAPLDTSIHGQIQNGTLRI